MSYQNPQIPEGINTSKEHPLKEFAWLLGGATILLLVIVSLMGWFGASVARLIPFEVELKLSEQLDPPENRESEHYRYLDALQQKISKAMNLSEGYRILLRYNEGDTVNAFATVGGNVILYRGLLKEIPHENALVMLMAHEIAHVQHRDPVVGLGRGVLIQLGLATVFGRSTSLENVLGQAGMLHTMRYSRKMETAADEAALKVLAELYGHVAGSTDLFQLLHELRTKEGAHEPPEFFSSHPLDQNRINRIKQLAEKKQWSLTGETTSLPHFFLR